MKIIFVSLFILVQFGCSETKSDEPVRTELNEDLYLKEPLKVLAVELKSNDSMRIKFITTEKGYSSLLGWSDNLTDRAFINRLSKDLKNYNISDANKWNDSMIVLSLGKPDEILGATGGYLVLKRINNELRIDEFRGGK